nr:hypothetical protein [uncultured Methanosphaera sp.]
MAGAYTYNVRIKAIVDQTELNKVFDKIKGKHEMVIKLKVEGLKDLTKELERLEKMNERLEKFSSKSMKALMPKQEQLKIKNKSGYVVDIKTNDKNLSEVISKNQNLNDVLRVQSQFEKESMQHQREINRLTKETTKENLKKSKANAKSAELNYETKKARADEKKAKKESSESSVSVSTPKPSRNTSTSRVTTSSRPTNYYKNVGTSFGQVGEKFGNFSDSLMGLGSILGGIQLKQALVDTPARAETNKYMLKVMADETTSADQLYNTLDKTTDQLPISMQNVVQPLYAFKAATGASADTINSILPQFANFGATVLNLTGSTDLAETAMMKLGYGLQGRYQALDQYGITEDALKRTGKWDGDENDITGFMDAVTDITGDSKDSMNTFNGQVQMVGKALSRAGKQLWEMGIGDFLKGLINGFLKLDSALGGWLSKGGLLLAAGGTALTGFIAMLGYGSHVLGAAAEGWRTFQDLKHTGFKKAFKDLWHNSKGAEHSTLPGGSETDGTTVVDVDKSKSKDKSKDKKKSKKADRPNFNARSNKDFQEVMKVNIAGKNGVFGNTKRIYSQRGVKGVANYGLKRTTTEIKNFGSGIKSVTSSLGSLVGGVTSLFTGLSGLAIGVAALTALFAFHNSAMQNSTKYSETFQNLINHVGALFQNIGGGIGNIFKSLGLTDESGMNALYDVGTNILGWIILICDSVSSLISKVTGYDSEIDGPKDVALTKLKNSKSQDEYNKNLKEVMKYAPDNPYGELAKQEGVYGEVSNDQMLRISYYRKHYNNQAGETSQEKHEDAMAVVNNTPTARVDLKTLQEINNIPFADLAKDLNELDSQTRSTAQSLGFNSDLVSNKDYKGWYPGGHNIDDGIKTPSAPAVYAQYQYETSPERGTFETGAPFEIPLMRVFNKQQLDAEKNPDYNASVSASLNETSLNANDWNVTKLTASNFTYDKENAPDGTLKKQYGDYQPKSPFELILHDIADSLGLFKAVSAADPEAEQKALQNATINGTSDPNLIPVDSAKNITEFDNKTATASTTIDSFNDSVNTANQSMTQGNNGNTFDILGMIQSWLSPINNQMTPNNNMVSQSGFTPQNNQTQLSSIPQNNQTQLPQAVPQNQQQVTAPNFDLSQVQAQAQTAIQNLKSTINTELDTLKMDIPMKLTDAFSQIPQGITNQTPAVQLAVSGLGTAVDTGLGTAFSNMGTKAGTEAQKIPQAINNQRGAVQGAASNLASAANSGFDNLTLADTMQEELDHVISNMENALPQIQALAGQMGSVIGSEPPKKDHAGSPGDMARFFRDQAGYAIGFLQSAIHPVELTAGYLGASLGKGYLKNAPVLSNPFENLFSTGHNNSVLSISDDLTNSIGKAPRDISKANETNNSNNKTNHGNTVNVDFHIDKIDSKERIKEIGETIVKMMTWNNETAGRNPPDPFAG